MGNGGEKQYKYATTDVEVDKHPAIKKLLREAAFVEHLSRSMLATHGRAPVAFDDVFVVKYDAREGAQRELVRHVDAGDVSFMLALSPKSTYSQGGTRFDAHDEVVHLNRAHFSFSMQICTTLEYLSRLVRGTFS